MSTDGPRPAESSDFAYDGQDLEALADLPNYNRWILDRFGPALRGRVVEVGAGIGNFASYYLDEVDELVLVEPAANLFPKLQRRFADRPEVTPVQGYVDDWAGPHVAGTFDAVVLVNVLEHVEHDDSMLRTLYSLLKPGGSLLLFVPALQWIYGTLDALVDHYRRYSHTGLKRQLDETGFDVDRLHFFDSAGVLPWFVMGRVLKRDRFDAGAATTYDRFAVPLVSRVEKLLPLPFGKNLLAVARKPLAVPVETPRETRRAA